VTGNNVTKKGCGDVGATLEVIFIMVVALIMFVITIAMAPQFVIQGDRSV
jgi:hypothetical protein